MKNFFYIYKRVDYFGVANFETKYDYFISKYNNRNYILKWLVYTRNRLYKPNFRTFVI